MLTEKYRAGLRVREVASSLGVSERLAWQLISDGLLPTFKLRGATRIRPQAVEALAARLEKERQESEQKPTA